MSCVSLEYIYLGKVTVERVALKHFLEAAESLQIKGLSNLSRPPPPPKTGTNLNSSRTAATDLSSRRKTAAADKLSTAEAEERGSQNVGAPESGSRAAAEAAPEQSSSSSGGTATGADPSYRAAAADSGDAQLRAADPAVQMVRIVKKRSGGHQQPASPSRAGKRPKRPENSEGKLGFSLPKVITIFIIT